MTTTTKKTGRKQKHYEASNGETINGLSRQPDGRWRIIGTAIKFTEHDEARAIDRFREMTMDDATYRTQSIKHIVYPYESKQHQIWKWFGDQIRQRPKWIAEVTGIEQIGYLADLPTPEAIPTFDALKDFWKTHTTVKADTRRHVVRDFEDFISTTGINDIRGITTPVVIAYRAQVYSRENCAGKRQQHLFNHIRRMLKFAAENNIAPKTCRNAVETLKLLTPNSTTVSLCPMPIEPGDFRRLLDAATGDDRAMVLLTLNCALHLQECVNLEWSDIHGDCLIAHRRKKGKFLRIATLWSETLEALKAVKRHPSSDRIFIANTGAPITISGAGKRFRKLRTTARLEHVESDMIRDGAATAVAAANINDSLFNLLMGHRCPGVKDHYAKRNPKMVQPACDAVHAHYFPAKIEGTAAPKAE